MAGMRFWQKSGLTLLCGLLAGGAGFYYLGVVDPTYEAETRLLITENANPGLAPTQPSNGREFIATQAELIRSPLIVKRAIGQVPIQVPEDAKLDEVSFALEQLTVSPILQTEVLSIRYRSPSPRECVSFVKAVVESYRQHLRSTESSSNTDTMELLTQREDEIRNELRDLNERHLQLRKNSQLVGQSRDAINVHLAMLSQLAQNLTETRLKKLALAGQLESLSVVRKNERPVEQVAALRTATVTTHGPIESKSAQRDLTVADLLRDQNDVGSQNLVDLENQLRNARIRFQQVEQKFGERHIESRLAQSEVENLEQLFNDRLSANTESLKLQLARLTAAEADLSKLYDQEQKTVKALDTYLIQDEKLRAEIGRTELIYNTVVQRLNDLQLNNQALKNGQASVVVRDLQGSNIHSELVWPQPKSFLALCIAFGLISGFLVTFGYDILRAQMRAVPS